MKSVLLAYYSFGETPKVILKLEELFSKKDFLVTKEEIKISPDIEPKKQFKHEKKIVLENKSLDITSFDAIIVGTPIVSFTSVPAINVFIRNLPKANNKKFVLFATGIGLPGRTIKKMKSLLSMRGGKVIESQAFTSIFEFDKKKLIEVEKFFDKLIEKI